jgi:hypothetical protein
MISSLAERMRPGVWGSPTGPQRETKILLRYAKGHLATLSATLLILAVTSIGMNCICHPLPFILKDHAASHPPRATHQTNRIPNLYLTLASSHARGRV